jgi:molybdate transport system regulatory protein
MKSELENPQADQGLHGNLRLAVAGHKGFAAEQIRLMQAVDDTGSISAAAKQVGISYKTAWDRVEAINNLSAKPLVNRAAGGAQGGGTALTEYGRHVVNGFLALEQEHQRFLQQLNRQVQTLNDVAEFMSSASLKTSIRNQFRGQISKLIPGAVNNELRISISEHQELVAIISNESCQSLALELGTIVTVLVDSSSIFVSTDLNLTASPRNRMNGSILRITEGAVNGEIVLDIGAGKTIAVSLSNGSLESLELAEGQIVCVFFKASDVVLLLD